MELTGPGTIVAVADAAPAVFTVFGVILNTDQLIAATHAAISLGQTIAVCVGAWIIVSTEKRRADEFNKRYEEERAAQKKRHEAAMAALDKRHEAVMAA